MVCYCSAEQFEGGSRHECGEPVDPAKVDPKFGKVCRLNKLPAGVAGVDIVDGGGPNGSEIMLVSSGGKKNGVRAVAAAAGAALGTAAAMFL